MATLASNDSWPIVINDNDRCDSQASIAGGTNKLLLTFVSAYQNHNKSLLQRCNDQPWEMLNADRTITATTVMFGTLPKTYARAVVRTLTEHNWNRFVLLSERVNEIERDINKGALL